MNFSAYYLNTLTSAILFLHISARHGNIFTSVEKL